MATYLLELPRDYTLISTGRIAPEWWPQSNRNAGRIPVGTVAAFPPESWPDSSGIRSNILKDLIKDVDLGVIASGLLKRMIDFKEEGPKLKAKRKTEKFWETFLGDVEKRELGKSWKPKPSIEKETLNLIKHIKRKSSVIGLPDTISLLQTFITDTTSASDKSISYNNQPITW